MLFKCLFLEFARYLGSLKEFRYFCCTYKVAPGAIKLLGVSIADVLLLLEPFLFAPFVELVPRLDELRRCCFFWLLVPRSESA